MKSKNVIAEIAEILAAGILRLHLRDVRKKPISLSMVEIGLEVSTGVIPCRLEPKQRGERR